ncbi:hypothetical protein FN976_13745 [Caenimonas sedimenti]|uniref:Uncharacterized protein n=2 Tax=Caenimonas sedimenti TaxID=2596921 RepID=A0A562ZQE6_9BURK|nr:hypothetical protein FN976_13745 [Caenimonas sedimenti]
MAIEARRKSRALFLRSLACSFTLSSAVTGFFLFANVALGLAKPDLRGAVDVAIYWVFFSILFLPLALLSLPLDQFRLWFTYVYLGVVMLLASLLAGAVVGGGALTLLFLNWALGRHGMRVTVPVLLPWCVVWCTCVPALFAFQRAAECSGLSRPTSSLLVFWPSFFLAGWLTWRWAGARIVAAIVDMHERKRISEFELQLFAWLVILCALIALVPAGTSPATMLLVAVGAPLAFLAAHRLLVRRPSVGGGPSLLVLRVFRTDRNAEKLLESVAHWWRFIGPAHLIAGPDLAHVYVAPLALLRFMTGRFQAHAIAHGASATQVVAALDGRTDPDGRYRINSLVCAHDAWQPVVRELVMRADAILLDLRSMTPGSKGVLWEINLIVESGRADAVVALVDAHDRSYPFRTVAWTRKGRPGAAEVFDLLLQARYPAPASP